MTNTDTFDFQTQVANSHAMLLKYALLQLRNHTWAQDVVSDVILAALSNPNGFSGKSSIQTWLVGILKFKIIDHFHQNKKESLFNDFINFDETTEYSFKELENLLFNEYGHSLESQALWVSPSILPDASLQEKHFFNVLEACVNNLPVAQGRAFMMREWLDLSSAEICQELCISPSNLWTLLHRARTRLQVCLNIQWFAIHST